MCATCEDRNKYYVVGNEIRMLISGRMKWREEKEKRWAVGITTGSEKWQSM